MTSGTARGWAKEHQGNAFEGYHPEVPFDVVAGVNKMLTDSCQKIGDTGLKFKPYSRTVPGDRESR